MIFTPTPIAGAYLVDIERLEDERGFFARSYCREEFEARGLVPQMAQCDISFNRRRGTLRGMHYQTKPFEEAKLVRCTSGAVHDVIVDIRPGSATFREHFGVVLSAADRRMLYVPEGVAHGFLTLSDDAEVFYQISEVYSNEHARGFRWNDPAFGIEWPSSPLVISERDSTYPDIALPCGRRTMDGEARIASVHAEAAGREAYGLIRELYPLCRSITGDGLRRTLEVLKRYAPLQVNEVPTNTRVFDWTVPREWNIRDAWAKDPQGRKVIDFADSNLHVVSYSVPVHRVMPLQELKAHIFTLPDRPDWIPYRTSYYEKTWGFCMRHRDLLALADGEYEVLIDSTLEDGFLTYGELYLPGDERTEVLVSAHACHPSLCNDNLSGVSLAALLARRLGAAEHRLSYRFLFVPGTIGAITWLARNEHAVGRIAHGIVLSGLGDAGVVTYKRSRRGDAAVDRAFAHVLSSSGRAHALVDFDPYGYDERQYCSPGFDLAVGNLSRSPYGRYPEYHTSGDDLGFVSPEKLADSFATLVEVLDTLERNRTYLNLKPKCEPQLGRRGLYSGPGEAERALLWVLNQSDGTHDLLDIAAKAGLTVGRLSKAAGHLAEAGLLRPVD